MTKVFNEYLQFWHFSISRNQNSKNLKHVSTKQSIFLKIQHKFQIVPKQPKIIAVVIAWSGFCPHSITHICCFLQNSAWYLMSSCQMHLIVQHICSSSPCPISINLELRGRGSFWGCNYNHASPSTATCLCWTVRSTCVRGKKTSNSGVTRCWMMFILVGHPGQ